jgi:integrase
MFRMAEEWGHVAISPGRRVKLLVDDGTVRTRYLTHDEIVKLVSTAEENRKTRQFGFSSLHFTDWPEWIMLNANTGLRNREMLFLEFTDVDWNAGVLHIRKKPHLKFHPKSHQERRIPINEPSMSALRSLLAKKHAKSEFIFHQSDGSRWKTVRMSFGNLMTQCGLKDVTLHTLRHTFGAQLAQNGIDMKTIKELMGHSSVTITEKYYAHLSNENLDYAVRVLAAAIGIAVLPKFLPTVKRGLLRLPVSGSAEKRTRTSTPLRGLEPESSASANSAISAKAMNLCSSIGEVNRLEP